jgi:hypothetical protein
MDQFRQFTWILSLISRFCSLLESKFSKYSLMSLWISFGVSCDIRFFISNFVDLGLLPPLFIYLFLVCLDNGSLYFFFLSFHFVHFCPSLCVLIEYMGLFQFSYIFKTCSCVLRYDLFWRKFHGLLSRMDFVQLMGEMLCRCLLIPLDL